MELDNQINEVAATILSLEKMLVSLSDQEANVGLALTMALQRLKKAQEWLLKANHTLHLTK